LFPYNSSQSIGDISKTVAKLYAPLMRLFAYRNKVIWAYTQSRQLKASLKHSSGEIQQFVNQLIARVNAPKVDLKELQKKLVKFLTISSAYASNIIALEQQENTIKTNLQDYNIRLKTIGKDMENDAEAFKFMANFSDFAKEKYVGQMEADNQSLSGSLRLLENAIQTIEGMIEIERAKSDRTLNVTIGTVGVGIGISGVYASTYASQIKSPASPQKSMDVNAVFWWSICWGIVASAIVFALIKIIGKNWR
jgi:chromosome segregation ATPase